MSARAPRRLSPWRRLAALLLDYLVIFAWMTVLAVASLAVNLTMGDSPDVLGAVGPFGAQAVFSTLLTLPVAVSYTHLRAHETDSYLVCRLLLEKKKKKKE